MNGGHQERGLRGGTSNTTGIVGLAAAFKLHIKSHEQQVENIKKVSDYLYKVLSDINSLSFNSDQSKSIPAIINIAVDGVSGSDLQIKLDLHGIATSMGAACAAGAAQASTVLLAMGQDKIRAEEGIRLSLGRQNTMSEAKKFIKIYTSIINEWKND